MTIRLTCKRCSYEWDYRGKSKYYVSCPRCKNNINIRKLEVENEKKQ